MKRFRSNFGEGLALVALAIVFALWLGHFDGTTARAASAIQPAPSPLAASSAAATRDKGCTVCAFVTLADQLFSATPPLMMLPEAVELLYRTTDAEFVHLKSAGLLALPRAHHHAS